MNDTNKTPNKPIQVSKAITLLWISVAIGVVIALLDYQYLLSLASPGSTFTITVFVLAIMVLLIYAISAGRNWARIIFLVLFILGAFPYMSDLIPMFSRSTILGILSLLQMLLQLVALYFIFTTPGAKWFKKLARQ